MLHPTDLNKHASQAFIMFIAWPVGIVEDYDTLGLYHIYAYLSRQTRDVEPLFNVGPVLQTMGQH